MKRILYEELKLWKEQKSRLPLIIRGARQVGKSYLIEQFGKEEFTALHVVNFEKHPYLKSCFVSLDPKDIIRAIELQSGMRIKPGALLFLDEIQDCPEALKSLRYFAEEFSELHVIAAGSLLEFVLEDKNFSFPVGRVQIMNLGPLTFSEYLLAMDQPSLVDLLHTVQNASEITEGVHERLLKYVDEFLCIGGMPGVVAHFKSSNSYLEVQRRQSAILDLYALDFGKYASKQAEHRHLKKLFEQTPNLVGKHFKFSKIDPDCKNPARDYREALHRLTQARLIIPVHMTKGTSVPLKTEKNEKKFKVFLIDIGLLICSIGWETLRVDTINSSSFRGAITEQFVAQELLSAQDPYRERGLYYWENLSQASSAEIDFLIQMDHMILPIEVKSGNTGRLKSLRQFMELKKTGIGIRIAEKPLSFENGILSIPFYLVGELHRLVQFFT